MNIVKILWFALGIVLLGIAYVGIFLPGLPWSTPAVCAAYCFAKSSTRNAQLDLFPQDFRPISNRLEKKRKSFPQKQSTLW